MKRNVICLLFSLLILEGCSNSGEEKNKKVDPYAPVKVSAFWLDGPEFVKKSDEDLALEPHAFIDPVPFSDASTFELNFVPMTLKGDKFLYNLDTASGQIYREKDLCKQRDVWKRSKLPVYRPPFTEGFIPRLLNQNGKPQRIIVFGSNKNFKDFSYKEIHSYRVRVVGGLIFQYCDFFPCGGNSKKWLGSMILVAVPPKDPDFGKVKELEELKKKMGKKKWDRVVTYLENYRGRTFKQSGESPAYRIIGDTDASKSFRHAFDKGLFFQMPRLRTLKKSCWSLYDFTWKSLEKIRSSRPRSKTEFKREQNKRAAEQIQKIFESRVIDETPFVPAEKENLIATDFARFFDYWYKNFGSAYAYCRRFLPAANHRVAPRRHWTMEYLWLFLKLEEYGYVYQCPKRAWLENPKTRDGRYSLDPYEAKKNCTTYELDQAFEQADQFIEGLRINNKPHPMYLEYDFGDGGTHQRLFSWVESRGKKLSCIKSKKRKLEFNAFPDDVKWEPFDRGEKKGILIRPRR
ncbi:MAG: hypothetical protein ACPGJV_11195 [Bacteriovoracaceae bacterium]